MENRKTIVNVPNQACPVILKTGFRLFFLGAAVYSVLSMFIWLIFYVGQGNIYVAMPLTVWHAHEMIFGFTMAVVAGFLLTAVINWTGQPTLSGMPLFIVFMFWALARGLAFMPADFPLWPLIFCNCAFMVLLAAGVIRPIIAVKQWRQSAVFSKLMLIWVSSLFLYAALLSEDLITERKALRFAVYMLISLILTIARRVMPFFIERGVGYPVTLRNSRLIDMFSLVLIILLSIIDPFFSQPAVVSIIAGLLVLIHIIRLYGWYTPGIWTKPLLWILFLGYIFLIIGFMFKTISVWNHQFDDSALHAFTAGGIGVFTLGMMARVAWGHTGRNIAEPPGLLPVMFCAIIASALIRIFFTLGPLNQFGIWIGISQVLWMLAFIIYLIVYTPVLILPRPDGED